jgi:hypothetical protein
MPSAVTPVGELAGPVRLLFLANNKMMLISGEGTHPQAEALLIFDKTDFSPGDPLTLADVEETIKIGDFIHDQGFMNSNPFNVDWDADGNIIVADAGGNSILKRDKNTGALSILKTLDAIPNPLPFGPPFMDPVPTDVLTKPDGSFYVSQLTGFPFVSGISNVFNLDAAGNLSVFQSGFTLVTDMAFDPKDGELCILQMGEFGPVDTTLNFILGTAKVIKLFADGTRDTIASGIGGLSSSMNFDANGDLYLTDFVFGQVLKFALSTGADETKPLAVRVLASPNPFVEQVQISYELESTATVRLDIYDLQGRKVHAVAAEKQGAGSHAFTWNDKDAESGMYVWRLQADGQLTSGLLSK